MDGLSARDEGHRGSSFKFGSGSTRASGGGGNNSDNILTMAQNACLVAAVRYFIHDAARSTVEVEGELRSVTTLFLELLGIDDDLADGVITGPQVVMSVCLACLRRFGGSIRQFTVDDKGCVLIGAFGLPGSSHEDNSRRAVEAALTIRKKLEESKISSRCGISQGLVFCGLVGSTERCEYAMMGASVNLAARLMGKCASGEILVSETVFQASQNDFVFELLPPVKAKGYSQPVAVYRPAERAINNVLLNSEVSGEVGFVGRTSELSLMLDTITDVHVNGSSHLIMVEGPPSIGKTRLVAEVLRIASGACFNFDISTIAAAASSAHVGFRYFVIRQLLEQLLGLTLNPFSLQHFNSKQRTSNDTFAGALDDHGEAVDAATTLDSTLNTWIDKYVGDVALDLQSLPRFPDVDRKSEKKTATNLLSGKAQSSVRQARLPAHGSSRQMSGLDVGRHNSEDDISVAGLVLRDLTPLVGEVFDIKMVENLATAGLSKQKRKELLEALLVQIFQVACGPNGCVTVMIVDNLQWCDWPSMKILVRVLRRLPKGLFIGLTRPLEEIQRMRCFQSSLERQRLHKAVMYILSLSQTVTPPPLSAAEVQLIIERTIGARLLQTFPSATSSHNVECVLERCGGSPLHATVLAGGLKNALLQGKFTGVEDLPAGADNLIISRFDDLSKPDQAVIKTASVIGLYFQSMELANAMENLGQVNNTTTLDSSLKHLVDANLIALVEDGTYRFSDRSVQESIYNLMLGTQREKVHGIHADFLELWFGADINYFDDIVYHYSLSDNVPKKLEYLRRASEASKRNHNYDLVCKYSSQLIKLIGGTEVKDILQLCAPLIVSRSQRAVMLICGSSAAIAPSIIEDGGAEQNVAPLNGGTDSKACKIWKSFKDFKYKVKPTITLICKEAELRNVPKEAVAHDLSMNLCSHVLEMGLAQIM